MISDFEDSTTVKDYTTLLQNTEKTNHLYICHVKRTEYMTSGSAIHHARSTSINTVSAVIDEALPGHF